MLCWLNLLKMMGKKSSHIGAILLIMLLLMFSLTDALGQIRASNIQFKSEVAPLSTVKNMDAAFKETAISQVDIIAANRALEFGLTQLAEGIYETLLMNGKFVNKEERDRVLLNLSTALISQKKWKRAYEVLSQVSNTKSSAYLLRWALVDYSERDWTSLRSATEAIVVSDLSIEDRPWYFLLNGLKQENEGKFDLGLQWYDQARHASVSEAQKAEIDAMIFRAQIFSGNMSSGLLEKIKKNLDTAQTNAAKVNFALEYAVVLFESGKKADAINFLKDRIQSNPTASVDELSRYWMLLVLFENAEGETAFKALIYLVKNHASVSDQLLVLHAIARSFQAGSAQVKTLLDQLIEDADAKGILASLLMARAYVLFSQNDYEGAQKDAERVRAQFPGESQIIFDAQSLLIYIALNREPPQYRSAVNYILQLEANVSPKEKPKFDLLAGDCYFMNNDFANAAAFYTAGLKSGENLAAEVRGMALYQLVVAYLQTNDLTKAQEVLGDIQLTQNTESQWRWQSEWNLIYMLKFKDDYAKALERVGKVLAQANTLPPGLRFRLGWLQAELSFDSGRYAQAAKQTKLLVEQIKSSKGQVTTTEYDLLLSYTYLLEGKALLADKHVEVAFKVFEELRKQYEKTDPAALSYLAEARYYASINNSAQAQQKLVDLVDKFADNENVPTALFEAAINAENRGLPNSYREALALLERLCVNYPNNPLVFEARLKQADLMRKLNDFSGAQVLYETVVNTFPNHMDRYVAMMGRAECLLAQGGSNPLQLESAANEFERIFDMAHIPSDIRVEAGYKWGYALELAKEYKQAQEAYWMNITQFLLNANTTETLQSTGRFWMAKTLFTLASLFEKQETEANNVRALYELIIKYNLPGRNTAQTKLH